MRYRKLRIASSVAWGVVAVLLIVLWIRSYWYFDSFNAGVVRDITYNSASGSMRTIARANPYSPLRKNWDWYSELIGEGRSIGLDTLAAQTLMCPAYSI